LENHLFLGSDKELLIRKKNVFVKILLP